VALLEKAAGQGHAYAMSALGEFHNTWKEYEQSIRWYTMGAETGLPMAMFNLGVSFEMGQGMAAPDYPGAAVWYRRAADAGDGAAALNLSKMYSVGRGWAWQRMHATSSYTL